MKIPVSAHLRRIWIGVCMFVLMGASVSLAQTTTATVEGLVVDVSGAAIAGADVTVTNTSTGITRMVKSDGAGRYLASDLNPGPYQVSAEATGFTRKLLTGLTLAVSQDLRMDLTLLVGQSVETVSVEATENITETQTSSNGTVIDNKKVVELPLANRQFYSLALLSPGAYPPAQNSTLGFRGGFNVAGAPEISNQFTINGIYDNDMGVAQPSFRPSVEDIQEFKLLTGAYSAEYGRMSGGQVVIVSKSGSNTFHGSAYEFIRNQVTDAKPFFTAADGVNPAFKQNTFGGTIGGPILKDKTFFFFAYEGQRIRQQIVAQATVPAAGMLQGQFNDGKTLYNPSTGQPLVKTASGGYDLTQLPLWNSAGARVGQQIATLGFPAPTFATAAGSAPGNNYNFSETRQETMNEESLRIDHKLTDQDSIFGTWNYFRDPAFEPSNTLCGSSVLPKFGCFSNQFSTLANVTYDRIFSANLLNEVRFGFDRLVQPRVTEDNTAIGTAFGGLPGAFTQPNYANNLGLPNTTVLGYSTVGGATNLPQKRWDDHYQIVDELTWNHGPHTVKAGADLFLVRTTDLITTAGRGALTFNPALLKQDNNNTTFGTTGDAMADMLLGLPATTSNTPTAPMVYMNFQSYDFFGQDDWKITPSLTLNLGLRWEMDLPVYSPHNTFSNFQLASQSYLVAGPKTYQHLYHYDYNNFAPRVGFAYQPFHKETTVIKGAFGIYYDTPLLYNEFLGVGTQYPFRVSQTYTPGPYAQSKEITLGNPFPAGSTGKPLCATGAATDCASNLSPLSINPNYATPYITEWSLGVQRALSSNLLLEVTYFGTKGTRLPFGLNVNTIAPNTMGNAAAQSSRPYPNFLGVTNDNTVSDSSYNSLQVKLQRSYANGISYLVAYTYGRSIDDGGGIGTGSNSSGPVQNPNNLAAERGPSDFNVQQRIVASPVAQLPFGQGKPFLSNGLMSHVFGGWSLMGIISAQTGRPFSVVDASTNNSGSFALGDRPNLVPGQNPNGRDAVTGNPTKTVKEWFNTHAFTLAPKGQFGNVGRNTITGPGYVDVDATVARSFDIYERLSGQFRLETFNLLNHPNFFNPLSQGMQYGTGAFGSITQANNNRELQGVVRFIF